MEPDYAKGDIVIKYASNGLIAISASENHEDHAILTLYEDGGGTFGGSEALIELLQEHFGHLMQSKRAGGLKMEVVLGGYENEED